MYNDNPVHREGVAQRIREKRLQNGTYTNNFKYGNGKISPHEQLVYDLLIENGFCNEATQNEMKDADEGYLAEIVMDTITGDNIYNLLAVDEFRDIVQEYISDAEE